MLIDTHAHIDLPVFNDDREQVLARARGSGVGIINVAVNLESSRASLKVAQDHPGVFTAVGFHPNEAYGMADGDVERLAELTQDAKVVAIGEIGLDFYRRSTPRQRQLQSLERQLDLAVELGLPVVIHSRQADKEMTAMLTRWVKSLPPHRRRDLGVMHCFSGDLDLAWRYIELGFLVSLCGTVTYPKAVDRVQVARELPADKFVVETDSPFLSPQLYRGKRNEPSHVSLVVERIAQIREVPVEVVAQDTVQNAINLFRLPASF